MQRYMCIIYRPRIKVKITRFPVTGVPVRYYFAPPTHPRPLNLGAVKVRMVFDNRGHELCGGRTVRGAVIIAE